MKRILAIAYEAGNVNVMLQIAAYGRQTGLFDLLIWSPYCLPESAQYRARALDAGTAYVEESTAQGGMADIHTVLSGWISNKPVRLPVATAPQSARSKAHAQAVLSALEEVDQHAVACAVDAVRRRVHFCEDWLVRLGVDAVVMAEDNVERDSHAWIEAARRRAIRTVVVSYGAISAQEAVAAYRQSPAHAVDAAHAAQFRQHLPHWLAEGDGFSILRLPLREALARELTETAPFNPWLVNAGHADVIVLESQAMVQAYMQLGFAPFRLAASGHPLQDQLARVAQDRAARRAKLYAHHRFSADRPLAVVAMPPDQSATCPDGIYPRYGDLAAAFARLPVRLAGYHVVVTPHPNVSAQQLGMVRATGAVVVEASAADVLPLADLYIACVSSTIKWAIGLGIPVINYDCYGYRYADYTDLPQVIGVDSEEAFRSALQGLDNADARARLAEAARRGAQRWGRFDGKAMERLVAICFGTGPV